MFARVFFFLLTAVVSPESDFDVEVLQDMRSLTSDLAPVGPSIALGSHGGGALVGGVRLKRDDPWLRVLSRTRRNGYDYGHKRLVSGLERVARRVARTAWPPAPWSACSLAAAAR